MSLPTAIDEWADAARELAKHCRARPAQRQARHKVLNLLRPVEGAPQSTLAHKGIGRALRTLMLDMQRIDEAGGPAAAHVAAALENLADALDALPQKKNDAAAVARTDSVQAGSR